MRSQHKYLDVDSWPQTQTDFNTNVLSRKQKQKNIRVLAMLYRGFRLRVNYLSPVDVT